MVAPTTPIIITTTLLTMTPDTTGTPAPWYRAAPILPIAPSVTSPTTRRQGRISAAMVCGILAHKIKKERLKPLSFYDRHFLCWTLLFTQSSPHARPTPPADCQDFVFRGGPLLTPPMPKTHQSLRPRLLVLDRSQSGRLTLRAILLLHAFFRRLQS